VVCSGPDAGNHMINLFPDLWALLYIRMHEQNSYQKNVGGEDLCLMSYVPEFNLIDLQLCPFYNAKP
jgi:hypothetical protein